MGNNVRLRPEETWHLKNISFLSNRFKWHPREKENGKTRFRSRTAQMLWVKPEYRIFTNFQWTENRKRTFKATWIKVLSPPSVSFFNKGWQFMFLRRRYARPERQLKKIVIKIVTTPTNTIPVTHTFAKASRRTSDLRSQIKHPYLLITAIN